MVIEGFTIIETIIGQIIEIDQEADGTAIGQVMGIAIIRTTIDNLEVLKYSLEQYIDFVGRQAFIHYCGLHQV